jgi:hypothetical protein
MTMNLMNPADLIAARRAYAEARNRAMESALAQGADPSAAARAQHQAMLEYLQARAHLLTEARAKALEEFDAAIKDCEQKIGQVEQLLKEFGYTPTGAGPVPVAGTAVPAKAPAPAARQPPPKQPSGPRPKPGGQPSV